MESNTDNEYAGRLMVIASSNGKETLLGPLLRRKLKVVPLTDPEFDSDDLRFMPHSIREAPIEMLRKKINHALKLSGESLAIATEASYEVHPHDRWLVVHTETAMIIDRSKNAEFSYSVLSLDTNYRVSSVATIKELLDFAEDVRFPSHGLCFTSETQKHSGITDLGTLVKSAFEQGLPNWPIHIQTDMRIKYNPTRCEVINHCVTRLLENMCCAKDDPSNYGFICFCGRFKELREDTFDAFFNRICSCVDTSGMRK